MCLVVSPTCAHPALYIDGHVHVYCRQGERFNDANIVKWDRSGGPSVMKFRRTILFPSAYQNAVYLSKTMPIPMWQEL